MLFEKGHSHTDGSLQLSQCAADQPFNDLCRGAFLGLHITESAAVRYMCILLGIADRVIAIH